MKNIVTIRSVLSDHKAIGEDYFGRSFTVSTPTRATVGKNVLVENNISIGTVKKHTVKEYEV